MDERGDLFQAPRDWTRKETGMKTTAIALILVLVFAAGAQAQMTTYGLKGGMTLANLTGDTEGLDSKTGFMIGGFAAIPIGESMSLQPEIFYVEKGAKESLTVDIPGEGTQTFEGKYKLSYIDIPILFKYTMAGESARPHFLAGPSIGFLTSAKYKVEDEEEDIKDFVKSMDFGLVFGAGVNFQKFLVEVRYNLGMTNLNDDPDDPDPSVKNGVWNFLVGVTF